MRFRLLLSCVILALLMAQSLAAEKGIRHSPNAVPNEYIVILNKEVVPADVAAIAAQTVAVNGGEVVQVWQHAIKGFFVRGTEEQALSLSADANVAYVEENAEMFLSDHQATNVDPVSCNLPTQTNCPPELDDRLWHLDRIDQDSAVPTNNFGYCSDGTGVHVYVVDTGVARAHSEFNNDPNRVLEGYNASGDGPYYPAWDPCHGFLTQNANQGHGTGVASLVAGRKVGVAKNAKIVPIKAMRCGEKAAPTLSRNTFYPYAQIVRANGSYYQIETAGTTGPTPPTTWTWAENPCCTVDGTAQLRYIGGSGAISPMTVQMVVDSVDWILRQNTYPKSPAVATFSTYRVVAQDATTPVPIGNGSISFEQAVRNLLAAGITVVASANNQNSNACDTSPARMSQNNPDTANAGDVITVGGAMILNNPDSLPVDLEDPADGGNVVHTTEPVYDPSKPTLDARWRCGPGDSDACTANGMAVPPPTPVPPSSYNAYVASTVGSNGGACVTLFAAAKNVNVASITGDTSYRDRRRKNTSASGTSWSAPIVAAVAARILQNHPTYSPAQVRSVILSNADHGALDPNYLDPPGVTDTPNILLHSGDVWIDTPPASKAASDQGPTTLTVVAHGNTPISYQWYRVNPEFNINDYHRGAAASAMMLFAFNPSLGVTPSVRTGYFVRVESECATTDSDIAVIVPRPAQPIGITVTANGNSFTVSWNAVTNAQQYHLERKVSGQAWTEVASTGVPGWGYALSTSLPDTPPITADGEVVYRVRASAGELDLPAAQVLYSPYSKLEFARTKPFTDEPVTINQTGVKALHIIELRKAINVLAEAADLATSYSPAEILESSLQGATRYIMAADFEDVRTRLNNLRTNAAYGLPPVVFRPPSPQSNTSILETHIADLRNGLK